MFAIPGVLMLLVLTYIRPQQFVTQLQGVPLLHLTYITTGIGLLIDLRLRTLRLQRAPILVPAALFLLWCIVTDVIHAPSYVSNAIGELFTLTALFMCVAFSIQSFRGFRVLVTGLIAIALFLSAIGIQQRLGETGCIRYKATRAGTWDGRTCDTVKDCHEDGEPGASYSCDHIGLFGSYAIDGRVKWIGVIQDPNELAMCIAVCIPLIIGLYLCRPNRRRMVLAGAAIVAILLCLIYTGSRGGQLVFLSAVGVYFVRRYGLRGVAICAVVALPVLAFGGRSGVEADESTMERIEALYIAMTLMVSYPLTGAGFGQFTNYNDLTAHNSYALSVSELGFPGLFLFATMLYLTLKTSILALQRYSPDGPAKVVHVWAGALIAAQSGFMIGIFLLSFNVHPVLWIFFATCTAFYFAIRRHDPTFEVTFGWVDAARVGAFVVGISLFMYSYSRFKMAGH
ncbi:MAG: O-antigen ligase family protein [Polyangia bacterium]